MARPIHLAKFHRRLLYGLVLLSWITGVCFFSLDRWMVVEGDFGPEKHPWQFNVLKIHGAAAFLMMVTFGSMLSVHVPNGWRVPRMRKRGVALVSVVSIMIVTGYLLYYLGNESVRQWVGYAHAAAGFCLPLVLIAHLRQGRQRRRRKRSNR